MTSNVRGAMLDPLIQELIDQDNQRREQGAVALRDGVCELAGKDFLAWVAEWKSRHGLTPLETTWILQTAQMSYLVDQIKTERSK